MVRSATRKRMLAAYPTYSAVYCAPPCFSCVDALASGAPFHLLMSGVHVTNAGRLNCRRVTVDILGTFLFVRVGWMRILAAAPYLELLSCLVPCRVYTFRPIRHIVPCQQHGKSFTKPKHGPWHADTLSCRAGLSTAL